MQSLFTFAGGEVSCLRAYHPVHCGACRRSPNTPYHPQLCSITPYHAEPYGSTQVTTPYHMISYSLVLICGYTLLKYSMISFHAKPHQTTILNNTISSQVVHSSVWLRTLQWYLLREGFKKKTWKSVVFCQTRGGVSGGGEKTKLLFWNRVFFREYLESF